MKRISCLLLMALILLSSPGCWTIVTRTTDFTPDDGRHAIFPGTRTQFAVLTCDSHSLGRLFLPLVIFAPLDFAFDVVLLPLDVALAIYDQQSS